MNKKRGRPPNIYLIDSCWRGNALRLYFGYSVEEICGDDWDDIPYESNCGLVYSEYVVCVLNALVPFRYKITDIADNIYYDSKFCRNDFKPGREPLFWITDHNVTEDDIMFFIGDNKDSVVNKLKLIGCLMKFTVKEV